MKSAGANVVLASLERGETVDILLKKKSVSNSLNYFFVNREIKNLVRKSNPDIVNPHFASGYGFSVAVSRVWNFKPTVLHCLGSDILISPRKSIAHKQRVIYALQRAKHIFADSKYLKTEIQNLYDKSNVSVIPWGVEQEILDTYDAEKNSKFENSRLVNILIPRPHQKVYNNTFIIGALANLLKEKNIKITFPGWGDDLEDFRKLVHDLHLEGKIEFYPFLERDEYINFLSKFDIYLSASLSDSSPASLIEAMGAGLIPVVANIPGVREWADHTSAVIYQPNNPVSLENKIRAIINNEIDMEPLLSANHKRVTEEALFENNINSTLKIMQDILKHGAK